MANQGNMVVLKGVRFSYPNLFTAVHNPKNDPNSKLEFSVRILVRKDDKAAMAAIKKAVEFVKASPDLVKKWGTNGTIPAAIKPFYYDGDTTPNKEGKIPPENAGCIYLNLKNATKPSVAKLTPEGMLQELTDERELYAGCYGIVSFTLVPYPNHGQGFGISTYLSNIAKTADGEPLAAHATAATDDFAEFLAGENGDAAADEASGLGGLF